MINKLFFQIRKIVKVTVETFSAVTGKVEGRRREGEGSETGADKKSLTPERPPLTVYNPGPPARSELQEVGMEEMTFAN